MEIGEIRDHKYDIGRCVIFYAPVWDGTTNLFSATGPLEWLTPTMGEVHFAPNPEYADLLIPEQLGPGVLKRLINGTSPAANFSVFPTIELIQAVSPTGVASLGFERQREVRSFTLWIVPERLLLKADALGFMKKVPVVLDAGVWKKDGIAIAAGSEDERLLEMSIVVWNADFAPITPRYRWEEAGRSDVEIQVTAKVDLDRPEGCNQVLVLGEAFGDYAVFDADIDFEPV